MPATNSTLAPLKRAQGRKTLAAILRTAIFPTTAF